MPSRSICINGSLYVRCCIPRRQHFVRWMSENHPRFAHKSEEIIIFINTTPFRRWLLSVVSMTYFNLAPNFANRFNNVLNTIASDHYKLWQSFKMSPHSKLPETREKNLHQMIKNFHFIGDSRNQRSSTERYDPRSVWETSSLFCKPRASHLFDDEEPVSSEFLQEKSVFK